MKDPATSMLLNQHQCTLSEISLTWVEYNACMLDVYGDISMFTLHCYLCGNNRMVFYRFLSKDFSKIPKLKLNLHLTCS